MARAVVTDIEGTTTPLAFVHEVLFPYARERLEGFLGRRGEEPAVRRLLEEARALAEEELGRPVAQGELPSVLRRWMDEDRKLTPLKALQGLIWEEGYARGELQGQLYEDAARALRRWREEGLRLYVYSSGSERAQRLLFGHTPYGDLTPLFAGFFDTRVGPKREAASYREIARRIGLPPGEILFLSDVEAELDAAREAGMATVRLHREGGPLPPSRHPVVRDFDAIDPRALAGPGAG
ncbi:MAG: acireductone synthase [Gammaproteobacteria bacterium]|nr:MAG: acireductone synthase [Gammaproteobacteria bacterium]